MHYFSQIKAHSGDYANDQADQLTKDAHYTALLFITTNDYLQQIAITPS